MASGTAGIDYPELREPVDVQAASRGDALMSFVEQSGDGPLTLTVPVDRSGRRVRVDVGEMVQLVWKGPEGLRALPAELTEVVPGDEPLWRVRPVGPAGRGQRRNAVRAPMSLPVEALLGPVQLFGETLDVSESGLHCLFKPVSEPPAADVTGQPSEEAPGDPAPAPGRTTSSEENRPGMGAVLEVTLDLESQQAPIRSKVEVVRVHPRTDRRIEVSVRFMGLHEREQDRIRARVFTELRLLRSRGAL
jgi:PilZ domain-containing protein